MARDSNNPLVKGTTMDSLINTAAEMAARDRTQEIVNMLRRVTPNSEVPWRHVNSGLDIADWLESMYLTNKESPS